VGIIPIKEEHNKYAAKIKEDLQNKGLRGIIDQRNESLNKRIREGTVKKIPYLLIVGDKEAKGNTVAVRKYGEGDQGAKDLNAFITQVCEEVKLKKH
jgi:threonyl-tRNA synthetase